MPSSAAHQWKPLSALNLFILGLVLSALPFFKAAASTTNSASSVKSGSMDVIDYLQCLIKHQAILARSQSIDAEGELAKQNHGFYPTLQATANSGMDFAGDFGNVPTGALALTADQPLFDVAQRRRLDAARYGKIFARFSDLGQVYQTSLDGIGVFFKAIDDNELAEIEEAHLKNVKLSIQLLGELQRLHAIDSSEVLFAKSDLLRRESRLKDLETERQNTVDLLKAHAAIEAPLEPRRFPEARVSEFQGLPELGSSVVKSHLEVQAFHYHIAQLSSLVATTENSFWPTLDVSVAYNKNLYANLPTTVYTGYTALLNFNWLIYDRSVRASEQGRLLEQKRLQAESSQQKEEELDVYLQNLKSQLGTARENLKRSVDKKLLSSQALDLAWVKLKLGRLSYVNFTQFENNYFDSATELINARSVEEQVLTQLYLFRFFSDTARTLESKFSQMNCVTP